jgi:hypothetical protein
MTPQIINIITNVIGILLAILEPVNSYFSTQPFNWTTFLVCLGGALVAYFTGKSAISLGNK